MYISDPGTDSIVLWLKSFPTISHRNSFIQPYIIIIILVSKNQWQNYFSSIWTYLSQLHCILLFCDRTIPTATDTHHTLTPMSPMLLLLTYLSANVSICNQMWQFAFADFSTYSIKHCHFANNANGFRLNDNYWFPHKLFVTAHQVKYYVPPSITANDINLFICLYTSNVVFNFLAKYIYAYIHIYGSYFY